LKRRNERAILPALLPNDTLEERIVRIRNLIADVFEARDYAIKTPESEQVVRDCDAALARLQAFLNTLEADN